MPGCISNNLAAGVIPLLSRVLQLFGQRVTGDHCAVIGLKSCIVFAPFGIPIRDLLDLLCLFTQQQIRTLALRLCHLGLLCALMFMRLLGVIGLLAYQ